jgi:hypothetical protein
MPTFVNALFDLLLNTTSDFSLGLENIEFDLCLGCSAMEYDLSLGTLETELDLSRGIGDDIDLSLVSLGVTGNTGTGLAGRTLCMTAGLDLSLNKAREG